MAQNRQSSNSASQAPGASRRPSLAGFPARQQSYYDVMPSAKPMRPSVSYAASHPHARPPGVTRHSRKLRPQYPPDSTERHVEYILVASFDIDRGSVMEHQYPAPIGGDEHMLAELMLPDQAHIRSQDWTIFFLHKDASADDEMQERKDRRRERREARRNARAQAAHTDTDGDSHADSHAAAADDDDTEDAESEDDAVKSTQGSPLVYVLNLVNTKQDNTVKRGAIVKAMAICTRHSFLHIYKPLLLLALEEYFRTPTVDTLAALYEAVNSMDLSLLPRLSLQERYILQVSDVKDLFIEKFESMIHQRVQRDKAGHDGMLPPSQYRQRYGLPRDTHEFESVVPYNNIPVPIKIPTALSVETVGDFSLIKLIQTFSTPHSAAPQPFNLHHPHLTTGGPLTHPVIVLLNALLTQKRVIFIGHNLPSSEVAEAVLAACALASGGLLRGFTRHAFPYTDLTKIDDLLKVPGFIAGVTNPAFAHHDEWWDLLCDLPTGRMKISPKIDPPPLTEGLVFFQQQGASVGQPHNAPGPVSSAGTSMGVGMGGFPSIPSGTGDPTGDVAFMASVLSSIADRRGETAVRAKFRLWVLKFIRVAAAFEELVYGASALFIQYPTSASPSADPRSPTAALDAAFLDPAVAGHGYVWPSNDAKMRELSANATRIEGWAKTRSYYNFVQDFAVMFALRPIQDLDLQHLHDKLTKLRLGADAAAAIYLALCARVKSYEQINQLLAVVNTSQSTTGGGGGGGVGGGAMFFLALGLFHPRLDVREAVAELINGIRTHEAGRHFWASLGRFEMAAFERVMLARGEREDAANGGGGAGGGGGNAAAAAAAAAGGG